MPCLSVFIICIETRLRPCLYEMVISFGILFKEAIVLILLSATTHLFGDRGIQVQNL